jgi:hypothetical protein
LSVTSFKGFNMHACAHVSLISSRGSSFRIAFSAVYRPASVRFEWNLTFFTAVSTYRLMRLSRHWLSQLLFTV